MARTREIKIKGAEIFVDWIPRNGSLSRGDLYYLTEPIFTSNQANRSPEDLKKILLKGKTDTVLTAKSIDLDTMQLDTSANWQNFREIMHPNNGGESTRRRDF